MKDEDDLNQGQTNPNVGQALHKHSSAVKWNIFQIEKSWLKAIFKQVTKD